MPGDPKECRMRAARCAELAATAGTPQLKAWFLGLSKQWERLAVELENGFAKLVESEALKEDIQRPLGELKRISKSQDPQNLI